MKRFQFIFFAFVAAQFVFASPPDTISFPDARTNALGGSHVALMDDFSVLFSNPAGLAYVRETLSVFELGTTISGPIFDILNLAVASGGDMSQILANITPLFDSKGRTYIAMDIGGPLAFGYVGGNFGFALFNRTTIEMNAPSVMNIAVNISEDIALLGGYSFKFSLGDTMSMAIGMMPKGFIRGLFPIQTDLLQITTLMSQLGNISGNDFSIITGIGVDAGVAFKLGTIFSAGLSCQDAFTPTFRSDYDSLSKFLSSPKDSTATIFAVVHPNLSVGVALYPPLGFIERYVSSVKVMLDYSDILDIFSIIPRNFILNFKTGVEIVLLDVLALRAGINDALLSAGFGLELSTLRVDFAMFGRELGLEPGSRPVYNISLNTSIRF